MNLDEFGVLPRLNAIRQGIVVPVSRDNADTNVPSGGDLLDKPCANLRAPSHKSRRRDRGGIQRRQRVRLAQRHLPRPSAVEVPHHGAEHPSAQATLRQPSAAAGSMLACGSVSGGGRDLRRTCCGPG